MGAKLGKGSGPVADMNLTPLIDIVLVVLIIMMVNIPIQIEEMLVKLPSSEINQPQEINNSEQLVVALFENGDIALNRRLMPEEVLFYEITRRLRPMEFKNVFIDAGPTITYGRVIDMVDLAREAGAAKVGLARLKEDGPLEPTSVAPGAMPRGVTFGQPRITGEGISEKKADDALRPVREKIEACYAQRLAAIPDLSGRLSIKATLGPQGEHMEPPGFQRGTTVEDADLLKCIEALLPSLTYPPLGEGHTAIVLHPLLFSPG